MEPKVTVLMPVYNGAPYLREAIQSVLDQTFTDFEFLIINDGSTDASVDIIHSYSDPRIRLVNNEKNLQLIATLNKGLKLSRGKYIVRMDCDDISIPERLAIQVDYMDKNPDVGVCGSWFKVFYGNNKMTAGWRMGVMPTDDQEIKATLLFQCPLAHPSTCLNRELLNKFALRYDASYIHAEDYQFWVECGNYFKLANVSKPLILYRLNNTSVSRSNQSQQIEATLSIIRKEWEKKDMHMSHELYQSYKAVLGGYGGINDLYSIHRALEQFVVKNEKARFFSADVFLQAISKHWLALCNNASYQGWKVCRVFFASPFSHNVPKMSNDLFVFVIKCILKKHANIFRRKLSIKSM